jgi:hypothetical protein
MAFQQELELILKQASPTPVYCIRKWGTSLTRSKYVSYFHKALRRRGEYAKEGKVANEMFHVKHFRLYSLV